MAQNSALQRRAESPRLALRPQPGSQASKLAHSRGQEESGSMDESIRRLRQQLRDLNVRVSLHESQGARAEVVVPGSQGGERGGNSVFPLQIAQQQPPQPRPCLQCTQYQQEVRRLQRALQQKAQECEEFQTDLDEALTRLVDDDTAVEALRTRVGVLEKDLARAQEQMQGSQRGVVPGVPGVPTASTAATKQHTERKEQQLKAMCEELMRENRELQETAARERREQAEEQKTLREDVSRLTENLGAAYETVRVLQEGQQQLLGINEELSRQLTRLKPHVLRCAELQERLGETEAQLAASGLRKTGGWKERQGKAFLDRYRDRDEMMQLLGGETSRNIHAEKYARALSPKKLTL